MYFVETKEVVTHFVPKYIQGKTLDVGGGSGKYASFLRSKTTEYYIADIEPLPVVDYVEDARKLSFADNTFDSVVSFQVLEHIDDTPAVLSEMYRVLRPGGHALITAPFLFAQHGHPSDFNRFTVEGLVFQCTQAGFLVREAGSQGSVWGVFADLFRCIVLNPYQHPHGRLRTAIARRMITLFKTLDRKGYWRRPDVYSNVYVVAQKI